MWCRESLSTKNPASKRLHLRPCHARLWTYHACCFFGPDQLWRCWQMSSASFLALTTASHNHVMSTLMVRSQQGLIIFCKIILLVGRLRASMSSLVPVQLQLWPKAKPQHSISDTNAKAAACFMCCRQNFSSRRIAGPVIVSRGPSLAYRCHVACVCCR